MVSLYVYGTHVHFVRIGFIGSRPLVYGVYAIDRTEDLPDIKGQTYREITVGQYEWIRNHLRCDVSFIPDDWPGHVGNLECRSCGCFYRLFSDGEVVSTDLWEDRQV